MRRLHFVQAIFQETLRLYPAIPFAPRVAREDTALGDYLIPEGARVFVSIYSVHRHPDLWDELESFMPERFLNEAHKERHRLAFMPFGAGQRFCVGRNLALLAGHLLLSLITQRVELRLETNHPIRKKVAINMFPRHRLPITVHPRKLHLSPAG